MNTTENSIKKIAEQLTETNRKFERLLRIFDSHVNKVTDKQKCELCNSFPCICPVIKSTNPFDNTITKINLGGHISIEPNIGSEGDDIKKESEK